MVLTFEAFLAESENKPATTPHPSPATKQRPQEPMVQTVTDAHTALKKSLSLSQNPEELDNVNASPEALEQLQATDPQQLSYFPT